MTVTIEDTIEVFGRADNIEVCTHDGVRVVVALHLSLELVPVIVVSQYHESLAVDFHNVTWTILLGFVAVGNGDRSRV